VAIGKLPDAAAGVEDDEIGGIFAEINITPLTDIILVLLIIVMAYAATAVTQAERRERRMTQANRSGLKVQLPEGAAKEIDLGANSLVVGITADGAIVVNGQPVNEEDLKTIFTNAYGRDNETQVVIRADGGVAHRRVVGVMESAKGVGLTRLGIQTQGGQ
jgi:biopolymer transport protein ExbD